MRKFLLSTALLSLAALTACGGGESDIPKLPDIGSGNSGPATTPMNSTLKGKIKFEGTASVGKPITLSDPGCGAPSVLPETMVVSDGGLEIVIIYVSGG